MLYRAIYTICRKLSFYENTKKAPFSNIAAGKSRLMSSFILIAAYLRNGLFDLGGPKISDQIIP
jgi:hypothetical protein